MRSSVAAMSVVVILRVLGLDENQLGRRPLAILEGIACLLHSSKRTDGAEFAGRESGISIAKMALRCMVVQLERVFQQRFRASI